MNNCLPRKPMSGLAGFGTSKAQAHLAKFCDINTMVSRALAGDTSVFRRGDYLDCSRLPESMQDMLNHQIAAKQAYDSLPEDVRKRYSSPELFLEACENPENAADFVKLGLAFERKPDQPLTVRVVNPEGIASPTDAPVRS